MAVQRRKVSGAARPSGRPRDIFAPIELLLFYARSRCQHATPAGAQASVWNARASVTDHDAVVHA